MSTRDVAEAILAGALPYGVRVSAPQGNKWLRAVDVPVIADILDTEPTRVDLVPDEAPPTTEEEGEVRTVRTSMFRTARGAADADAGPETRPATPPTPRYSKLDTTLESVGTAKKRNAGGC